MPKIIFKDVGRNKWNGAISIPDGCNADEIAEFAYKEAKKHLSSRFPDTEFNALTNYGTIMAGCRVVGHFHIETE